MTFRTATAVIDRQALLKNFNFIKSIAPKAKMLAVLKANAYGHGLEIIAKALPHADAFGVARIDEALSLIKAGIKQPIVLLEGFFSPDDLPIIAEHNLQIIIHNTEQLNALINATLSNPLKVWLKVDTGMHRLGINAEDFQYFFHTLSSAENVQKDIILMSHFGCADDTQSQSTPSQFALFQQITQDLPLEKSLANSAAVLAWPQTQLDWIRPGLLLYGISPMPKTHYNQHITPVMTLQSSLIAIRHLAVGETVGYGGAWQCEQPTTIGIVAIGYGDGYPRHAVDGTPVLINNRRVPIIGRVSMDMITVDLGQNAQDKVGDIAILWGKDLSVSEIAEYASTISYELLCNIARRVQLKIV